MIKLFAKIQLGKIFQVFSNSGRKNLRLEGDEGGIRVILKIDKNPSYISIIEFSKMLNTNLTIFFGKKVSFSLTTKMLYR